MMALRWLEGETNTGQRLLAVLLLFLYSNKRLHFKIRCLSVVLLIKDKRLNFPAFCGIHR